MSPDQQPALANVKPKAEARGPHSTLELNNFDIDVHFIHIIERFLKLLVNVDQCPNKLTTQVPVTVPMSGPAQRCPSVMLTPYFSEYSREQSDVLPTRNTACNQEVSKT